MALSDNVKKYLKGAGIIVCLVAVITLGYYVYDYGYMSGVADKQKEVEELKAQALEQQTKISELEQKMAQSAIEYEQLRVNLSNKEKEVKQWQQQFKDKDSPSLSAEATQFLNSLLQ